MTTRKVLGSELVGYLWPILALTLLLGLGAPAVQAQTAVAPAGTGTLADPYQVAQLGNLVWMSANVVTQGVAGKHYKVINDIDASDSANWSGGFTPIAKSSWDFVGPAFRGAFDGQGHAISGLTIDRATSDSLGLFGYVGAGGEVGNLALENVAVTGQMHVGGLVGVNLGVVTNCTVTGAVTGRNQFGGLVGLNSGTITNCHAVVAVTSEVGAAEQEHFGGLVGYNIGTITNCYATGAVTGGPKIFSEASIGGLAGSNDGVIANCYATGNVTAHGEWVGGLAGSNSGTVTNSYATGGVLSSSYAIGGLVGHNHGTITSCYATGGASATEDWGMVGGLVGNTDYGAITDCYATGGATGDGSVGGLIGSLQITTVTDCYAVGAVTGTGSNIGGLIGRLWAPGGTVTSSYWNTQTSGQSSSPGGTGKTTTEMKQQATFVGWNFVNVWGIVENATYPYLFGGPQQPPLKPANVSPADNAAGVALAPTLVASAFADANTTDTHAASQWQVRADAGPTDWSVTVFDSGATATALTSCTVPSNALASLTSYWWRVRYEDNHGGWSAWSSATTFATRQRPPSAPTGVAASDGTFTDRVQVTWAASLGAADYKVYRSTQPTAATASALTGWLDYATTYDDLTAVPGTPYYYWVLAATNATGSVVSDFSASDLGWAGPGVPISGKRPASALIIY